jgi:hypothetical protein
MVEHVKFMRRYMANELPAQGSAIKLLVLLGLSTNSDDQLAASV